MNAADRAHWLEPSPLMAVDGSTPAESLPPEADEERKEPLSVDAVRLSDAED
jgi:hypothetical protein